MPFRDSLIGNFGHHTEANQALTPGLRDFAF